MQEGWWVEGRDKNEKRVNNGKRRNQQEVEDKTARKIYKL